MGKLIAYGKEMFAIVDVKSLEIKKVPNQITILKYLIKNYPATTREYLRKIKEMY